VAAERDSHLPVLVNRSLP